jgi:hypothetical protein
MPDLLLHTRPERGHPVTAALLGGPEIQLHARLKKVFLPLSSHDLISL